MKSFTSIAAMLLLSIPAVAQTSTIVQPIIGQNGQVTVGVKDSSGGQHLITFPVIAVTTLSVGSGTDTYSPPVTTSPTITSVQVACSPASLQPSTNSQCNAKVQGTGSFDPSATFSASTGSVDANGLFTAPASVGTATVTATSTQDATKSGNATITVQTAVSNGAPTIPSNAVAVDLVAKTGWKNTKDAGTPGTATFSNNYPVTGIFSDDARAFSIAYQNGAGVRFSYNFAKDTVATHFVYDTVVQSPDWTHTANLELDLNQVKSNGKTAILGVQCSSYSKTWEVTQIAPKTSWHWVPTNVICNPLTWTPNVPHHIRIFGSIDATGVATYIGVELDNAYSAFNNFSGSTAEALGWSVGSVLPNFQIDGKGASGSATIYADKLTIIRW